MVLPRPIPQLGRHKTPYHGKHPGIETFNPQGLADPAIPMHQSVHNVVQITNAWNMATPGFAYACQPLNHDPSLSVDFSDADIRQYFHNLVGTYDQDSEFWIANGQTQPSEALSTGNLDRLIDLVTFCMGSTSDFNSIRDFIRIDYIFFAFYLKPHPSIYKRQGYLKYRQKWKENQQGT